jgi:hypothetical protein
MKYEETKPVKAEIISRQIKSDARRIGIHVSSRISKVVASLLDKEYQSFGEDKSLYNIVQITGMTLIRLDKENNDIRRVKKYIDIGRHAWLIHLTWSEKPDLKAQKYSCKKSWTRLYVLIENQDINKTEMCAKLRSGADVIYVHQS